MTLRHKLAPAWLTGLRLCRAIKGAPSGARIIILHNTPKADLPALENCVHMLRQSGTLAHPNEFDVIRRQPGTTYLMSFDDGFASNLVAAQHLNKLGVSALFFICPELVALTGENQRKAMANAFFGGRPPPNDCRLLTWDEIEEIKSLGHIIGAHGQTHARLTTLADSELEHEIIGAGDSLCSRLGTEISWYAYSFGDIGSISADAMSVIRTRYRYCRSGVRGINDTNVDAYALRGEEIRLDAPQNYQRLVLEGGLDAHYRRARETLDAMVKATLL